MRYPIAVLFCVVTAFASCQAPGQVDQPQPKPGVLIFTRTAGFRHDSIPTAAACLTELASELGMRATHSEDAADFTDENLASFAVVVFLSTTGDVLDASGQAAFERFIQAGGGFLGVHAATDTEYDWPWYTGLVGAQFESHPRIQPAKLLRTEVSSLATDFLPQTWERTDEWYNFKALASGLHVVLHLDESSYEGGTNGPEHPAAWFHEFDGGRAFYTAGGHTSESYSEPLFRAHLLMALAYATGLEVTVE